MAAIAFDTLAFARRLKEAGVPERQAEVQAELMAEAFVFNIDALVTRDYLDACLNERFQAFEARLDQKIDRRFAELESRFEKIDQRFEKIDQRFADMDRRFASNDVRFASIDGKFRLVYWMLGIIIASTTLPQLMALFGG